jgi:glutaminase
MGSARTSLLGFSGALLATGVLVACSTGAANNNAPVVGPVVPLVSQPAPGAGPVVMLAQASGPQPQPQRTPGSDPYREAVAQAYRAHKELAEGKNADYIPALAKVDPALYGVVLVTVKGAVYEIGNARNEFSIQSVSKPFTLAWALESPGLEAVQKRIGVNATGQKFNSILAIELNQSQKRPPPGNPFVNAGAIATVDLLPATDASTKWEAIIGAYSAFAGRRLTVNEEVYKSESETNTHNRAIAALLQDYEVIKGDPAQALDLYTRQCSISVSAHDLAVMGATLANGGRNPITNQQVVSPANASRVLAVMATAGLYETTGDWLVAAGVPAKSGVGGGIVAVMPGRYAIGTFGPPLDEAGNSVRGQKAIETIVTRLGGGVFASRPATGKPATTAGAALEPASITAGGVH